MRNRMSKRHLNRKTKEFIRWAQRDQCFLCSFSLAIYCHAHHIIPFADGGPDQYLNMVGLCANHHGMVEEHKRSRIPSLSKIGTGDPKTDRWLYKNQAMLGEAERFNDGQREAWNLLLPKYWPYPESLRESLGRNNCNLRPPLIKRIVDVDFKLLDSINRLRPRIYFPIPQITSRIGRDPYDITQILDVDLQHEIDQLVESHVGNGESTRLDEAICLHLINLEISPVFESDSNEIEFRIAPEVTASVAQIRAMSEEEAYSLWQPTT